MQVLFQSTIFQYFMEGTLKLNRLVFKLRIALMLTHPLAFI